MALKGYSGPTFQVILGLLVMMYLPHTARRCHKHRTTSLFVVEQGPLLCRFCQVPLAKTNQPTTY